MSEDEEVIREELLDEIPETYKWVKKEFNEILKNMEINRYLDNAYIETSKKNWINRHGSFHGLKTALNSLRFFKLIDYEIVDSSYEKFFEVPKPIVLFSLLVASYVHDVGRGYDPEAEKIQSHGERIDDLLKILEKMKEHRILQEVPPKHHSHFFRIVRELCLCHDMKGEASNKTEIAIVKLADALDCDKDRAYSEEDIEQLKDKGDMEKTCLILDNDKHPEMYFGCKGVDIISMDWNECENALDITSTIKDNAAMVPINTILTTLKACEKSREEMVSSIVNYVRLIIKKDNELQFLYGNPQSPIVPHLKIIDRETKLDILNEKGDGSIIEFFTIKNESGKRAIGGFPSSVWGFTPKKESELKCSAYQLINDKWEKASMIHTYTFDEGKMHWWRIMFKKPLKITDDPISIRRDIEWNGWAKTEKDELACRIIALHERLQLKIRFCREISETYLIHPSFVIKSKSEKTPVYIENLKPIFNDTTKETTVEKIVEKPAKNYVYSINWTLSKKN